MSVAEVGRLFPSLEVVECLGRGGMGVVYKARQPRLDRWVALKLLPSERQGDPRFTERFVREARTLARLSHPHIVAIHDFGEVAGHGYLLMEYVDGLNLRQLLGRAPLSCSQALAIVPMICEALQYAHEQGVVHRDIKPENILLDRAGRVKIADFGIAKLLGETAPDGPLTAEHQAIGTPHYMAPEQVERPRTVDHRADIYSLGVVFYEMLTGELPLGRFEAPSLRVKVDVRLDEVVLRALEKDPVRRYQQASQVQTQVETLSRERVGDASRAAAPAAAPPQPDTSKSAPAPSFVPGVRGSDVPKERTVGARALISSLWARCLRGVRLEPAVEWRRLRRAEGAAALVKIALLPMAWLYLPSLGKAEPSNASEIVLEVAMRFLYLYLGFQALAGGLLAWGRQTLLPWLRGLAFVGGLFDTLLLSLLLTITGGEGGLVTWLFVLVLVRNSFSMPPRWPQLLLNLLVILAFALAWFMCVRVTYMLPSSPEIDMDSSVHITPFRGLHLVVLGVVTIVCYVIQVILAETDIRWKPRS